jgi:hypothetical protein
MDQVAAAPRVAAYGRRNKWKGRGSESPIQPIAKIHDCVVDFAFARGFLHAVTAYRPALLEYNAATFSCRPTYQNLHQAFNLRFGGPENFNADLISSET